MSKILSDLLGATEPMFSLALRQLEQESGNPSADIRLTAEITGKIRLKTQELGLDPDDTTGKELYYALMNLIKKQDEHLVKQIGGDDPDDAQTLMPLMKKAWEEADTPKNCWVIKPSVAKAMLKKTPPKGIMKHLSYRSIDSMLKREKLGEIYGALRFAEDSKWLNHFNDQYKKLKPGDFETRQIEIVEMPLERWGELAAPFIHKKKHNITHLKELGVILMLPIDPDVKLRGITIFSLPLLFHYLCEIRLYSTFFKFKQMQPKFGEMVAKTLNAGKADTAVMAGQTVHWRVIQQYFGRLEPDYYPEIFEPHVQPEDLHWRRAEEMLFKVDPELEFWRDLDYVGETHAGRPVPLNLLDMAANYVNNTPYSKRLIYHFRDSLWNEIFVRYMGQKNLEQQILEQLDNDVIMPETLKV